MNISMYAVISPVSREAIVVSNSLRGAKGYATRHGYSEVCRVHVASMQCVNFWYRVPATRRWVSADSVE